MSRHTLHIDHLIIVLLFLVCAGSPRAAAQQGNDAQGQAANPPMSMVPEANGAADTRQVLLDQIDVKMYEAALGDPSLCGDDDQCVTAVSRIRSWFCAADRCDGTDKSKEPVACFVEASHYYPVDVLLQLNSLICPLVKYPSSRARKAFLNIASKMDEDELVRLGALALAYKGSATACEQYIKDYVVPNSPQWNYKWYRVLSGCRIIAKQRTRKEEEKDYSEWLGGNCPNIADPEMRKACSASGASSLM
jgi:hypothetical protein